MIEKHRQIGGVFRFPCVISNDRLKYAIWGLYELSEDRNGVDMVSLNEAKTAVLALAGAGMEISEISELPTGWVFGMRNAETKEEPDTPPLIVYKADGQVADFFPPDHMAELPQLKQIEGRNNENVYT